MTDVHTREQRSRNMAAIRGKNTKPEMRVRSALHAMGYRFRLHKQDLPGRPDIVLPRHRIAIFVNGCFWHCHDCRFGRVVPATRAEFWAAKRLQTIERDKRKIEELKKLGWHVITFWECEIKDNEVLKKSLLAALPKLHKSS